MRAVAFAAFGPPNVLTLAERPKPVPAAGQTLVRVLASPVNPTDLMMRDGRQAALMKGLSPPYVAGVEFCGIVEAAPAGSALAAGARVIGLVNARRPEGGAHADYICVPTSSLAAAPEALAADEAATIAMNGLTARLALEALALSRGGVVLITGGAGAAGGYAIELARQFGFETIADAREDDRALLTRLGATHVVPRGEEMGAAVRALFPGGVDGLVDAALVGAPAAALVRDGGSAVSLRSSSPINDPRIAARYVNVFNDPSPAASLQWLSDLAQKKQLTPRVAATLPPEKAAEAHRMVERGGLRGRIVLDFS